MVEVSLINKSCTLGLGTYLGKNLFLFIVYLFIYFLIIYLCIYLFIYCANQHDLWNYKHCFGVLIFSKYLVLAFWLGNKRFFFLAGFSDKTGSIVTKKIYINFMTTTFYYNIIILLLFIIKLLSLLLLLLLYLWSLFCYYSSI